MLRHPAAEEFSRFVDSAPCLQDDYVVLYRGQGIKESELIPPSVERMGPLPLDRIPNEGRYHRAGERVLYLTSSEDGARREMEAWCAMGRPYVIQIRLPLASLRIADFMDWPSHHFVSAVFSKAEECRLHYRGGPDNYVFSQVVAELVSARFDGMRIPGVRGEPGAHYSNIVLFRQLDLWPQWVALGTGPYPFAEQSGHGELRGETNLVK